MWTKLKNGIKSIAIAHPQSDIQNLNNYVLGWFIYIYNRYGIFYMSVLYRVMFAYIAQKFRDSCFKEIWRNDGVKILKFDAKTGLRFFTD